MAKVEKSSTTDQVNAQGKDKYLFFWRSNMVYSQWYQSKFELEGKIFNTAEQYMMYKKAILFKDKEIAKEIMETDLPHVQKALGRRVQNFDEKIWSKHCFDIVKKGNIAKFTQNEDLKKELIESYPKILVEASPVDKIWGIGLDMDDPLAWDEKTWKGTNLLGYAITSAREEIMGKK